MRNGQLNGVDLKRTQRQRNGSVSLNLNIGRLPPHDMEMEMGVIGCELLDPNQCIGEVMLALKGCGKSAFYDLRHQTIQETLETLYEKRLPIDLITVQQHLKERDLLENVGGIHYLSQMIDAVPSAANLSYYLETVRDKYMLRCAVQLCSGVVGRIYDYQGDIQEFLDEFEQDVLKLRTMKGNREVRGIREVVNEALQDIEWMYQNQGKISGMTTGFPDLDMETDGLHKGEYILIAALPSVGKTSLAFNIVEHVVLNLGLPVGVFSAEMTAVSLVKRSIASTGLVNMRDIRKGNAELDSFNKIIRAAERLAKTKLIIDDSSDMSTQYVRATARRWKQQNPDLALIVGDFAQLFTCAGQESRVMELDKVSKCFKQMGKELNVPVILLTQVTEDDKGKTKTKGARAFSEDTDGLWELKPKKKKGSTDDEDDSSEPTQEVEVWLRKQRNDRRNVRVTLTFLKSYTKFVSQAKVQDEENP